MICNKCNHKLPDDSEFCQYCGRKIENVDVVKSDTFDENSSGLIDELSKSDITPDDALSVILKFQAKARINAMEANADSQPDNEGDDDFGIVPEKPIFTLALKSVDGEEEYLDKLYTESGEKIKYTRRGSISAEGINGMIDIYDTFLPSGQLYKTIYINMYGAKASISTPKGFKFAEKIVATNSVVENKQAINNKRYCSRCGSVINDKNKTCTGCGKKYFKGFKHLFGRLFNKQYVTLTIVSFLLLISLIVNIVLAVNTANYSSAYRLSEDEIANYKNNISDLEYELSNLKNRENWIDRNVVFIEDDGTNLYHKYDCYKFKGNTYWVHNIEYAVYRGYKPCSWCCD